MTEPQETLRKLASKWWLRLPEFIRRDVGLLDIEAIVSDAYALGMRDTTERNAQIAEAFGHALPGSDAFSAAVAACKQVARLIRAVAAQETV